jgi:hypothetical protein
MCIDKNNLKNINKYEILLHCTTENLSKPKLINKDGSTPPELILFLIYGETKTNTYFSAAVSCS